MTSNTGRETRILGSLRRLEDGTGAVTMEDFYDTGIDDLWSALTDPVRLARWLATVEGDLRIGGRIHARFTSTFEGTGRIDVCDAPRRLQVTFDPGTSDETVMEANLAPVGDRTRLIIEERGLQLADVPGCGAGWQAHVEDLAAYLSGREPRVWRDRWLALKPAYQEIAGNDGK
ncbi:SRPBCC family protein [Actinoplanes sp. NPDC051513]|uniref:SRPBCC family protein n=1 Tax=Actinoplanes sp. NPDC051513 TaxID=3363908 RepID=UPI0037A40E8D